MEGSTSKTPAAIFEEMVNEVNHQLDELESRTNDIRVLTVENIVDNLHDLNDPEISDSEKVETVDAINWDLQCLFDEISIIASDAEEVGKYASELIDKFEKLLTGK